MNFKPTLWKSLIAVVISIIAFITGYWIKNNLVIVHAGNISASLRFLLSVLPRLDIYLLILSLILIYVIWSLFQKK